VTESTTPAGPGDAPDARARRNGAPRGRRALDWWRQYCDPANPKADSAVRARLRRARSHLDALRVTAAADLARRLGAVPKEQRPPDWLVHGALDLSRLLAHVKQHDAQHPMRAAGWKSFPGTRRESDAGDDRPRLSGPRFARLLETGDGEEQLLAFMRLVALLDGTVNVEQLANDFLMWNHPEYGDRVRERWAFEYLAAGVAAPPLPFTETNETEDDA
jgi:CRISPR system Cascade subunit CasB